MRPVIQEVGVVIQSISSGASPVPINDHHFTTAKDASSDILNLIYQFPANFNEDDETEGLYNPRFFVEGMPKLSGLDLVYKVDDANTEFGNTQMTGGSAMPMVLEENENFAKTPNFATADKTLKYLLIQLTSGSVNTPTYDTRLKDRSDPLLIMDFERQAVPQLDFDHPNANSDHLWDFSQVDLYVDWPVKIDGSTFTHRHLIGYMADEDLTANLGEEVVDFLKGKPMARVVRFISQLGDMISGTISTMDPWFFKEGLHLFTTLQNRQIVLTQKNVQRPIANYNFSLEWQTNSGHLKRLIFPKGQFFVTGEMTPGGSDISRVAFELTPIVTSNKVTYNMKCTQSQVQRTILPFGFNVI